MSSAKDTVLQCPAYGESELENRRDQNRTEKISKMQALVDEAITSGEGQRSMEQIEQEAQARLSRK